ncbi:hypothetical protein ACFV3D_25065, partial [Streptomyces sp. NPDC059708]
PPRGWGAPGGGGCGGAAGSPPPPPRRGGRPRAPTARHRAEAVRKRRLVLSASALALAAAVGVGSWLAASGDEAEPRPSGPSHSTPTRR